MGYTFRIYSAPASALKNIVAGDVDASPVSDDLLSGISDFALVRLQALLDGINDWGDSYEKVAVEIEDGDYAESHDGSWARVMPHRFCSAVASLTEEEISRILPEWSSADTHAGQHISTEKCRIVLAELRSIAVDAMQNRRSLILYVSE